MSDFLNELKKKRKLAVRLGKLAEEQAYYTIDFILDPLGAPIKPDLFEHIDGLRTCDKAYTQNVTAIHKK